MTSSSPLETGKPRVPYWYKIYQVECVLCGHSDEWRERMFTPKPEDAKERYDYRQDACPEHFL